MIRSIHALLLQLEARSLIVAGMNLPATISDGPLEGKLLNLANRPTDLDRCARAVEALMHHHGLSREQLEVSVRQLVDERHFYGTFCELAAYDWLHQKRIAFRAQVEFDGTALLNPNGATIDGEFSAGPIAFDIKAMGFQEYVADKFRAELAKQLPGLDVSLDGPMDVSVKDIERLAFGRIGDLKKKLAGGGIAQIAGLGWTVRAHPPLRVSSTTHSLGAYKLAEENRYYPFKTAGQFTRSMPFLLVFAYAAQFNQSLFLNFSGSTDVTLRAMSRRAFMQLTADLGPATAHDKQVAAGVTVADASALLSGLLFLNIDSGEAALYLNPRAAHRISQYHVDQLFAFEPMTDVMVDDFSHDDY